MKIIKFAVILLVLILLIAGCSPLFIQKNQLIVINETAQGNNSGAITARAKIEQYDQLFSGTILAYDVNNAIAVFVGKTKNAENIYLSELSIYKNHGITPLFNVSTTLPEAKIDRKTNDIYFKEKDIITNKSALYWTSINGDKKVRLTEDAYDKYIAWNLTSEGILVYVDNTNQVILGNQNEQVSVYNLPKEYIVKKISYVADENFILILAATSQTENILYRLNLDGEKKLSAIDVNISDFVVSQVKQITSYIKTTSGGQEQLYFYDHKSYLRSYVCSNYIEKISFSPDGNFLAFATKIRAEIPTQSIWIVKYTNDIPVQLTANTKLVSNIYWTEDEKGILFTTSDASIENPETEPNYKTYILKFSFEYFDNVDKTVVE